MTDGPQRGHLLSHPLFGVFPLTVMAVGTFLVVFALLLARLQPGTDGALNAPAASSLGEVRARSAPLTTRTSGGVVGRTASAPPTPSAGTPAALSELSTRTSGAGGGSSRDE